MQLQAGYFLESIKKMYGNKLIDNQLMPLLKMLSYFNIDSKANLEKNIDNPTVEIINNLISRGLPTRPSVFIENTLSEKLKINKKEIIDNKISFPFSDDKLRDYILRAFHITDSRIKLNTENKKRTDNKKFCFRFLHEYIKPTIGEYFFQQIRKDIKFSEVFDKYGNKNFSYEKYESFKNQKAGFIVEMPYANNDKIGLVVDIDAETNKKEIDYLLIEAKKNSLKEIGFDYIYAHPETVDSAINDLQYFTYNNYFDQIKKHYQTPLYTRNSGQVALQYALSPFAIARIQKTIIQFILSGNLKMSAMKWQIAVIERDVPSAKIAIDDLKLLFENFYKLQGIKKSLPKIELTIYNTVEFKDANLNKDVETKLVKYFDKNKQYDLLIDISMLLKNMYNEKTPINKAKFSAKIISSLNIESKRFFHTNRLLKYKASKENLEYFTQNIFRINELSETQTQALKNILEQKNTLYISQPKNDKILVSNLAILLQAGTSFIVNPNSTLLKEQFNTLRNNYIDGVYYINSSQRKIKQRREAIQKIANKEALISFISPDRLHVEDFTDMLQKMVLDKNSFAYLIVNRAEKISEFSNNFNPYYLNLHKNISNFCNIKSLSGMPVLALSSDENYFSQNDICNEFKISEKNVIIENYKKSETKYQFIQTNKKEKTSNDIENELRISANHKKNRLIKLLEKIDAENTIIFIPNKNNYLEVAENEENVVQIINRKLPDLSVGTYSGTIDIGRNSVSVEEAKLSEDNYFLFKKNKIDILVSTEISGEIIEKAENVIFMNFPASLQKFYQLTDSAKNVFVLYDDAIADIFEYSHASLDDGTIETSEQVLKINPDSIVKRNTLNISYPERKKELKVLDELLNKIVIPAYLPARIIEKSILKEFDEELKLSAYKTKDFNQILVKRDSRIVGHIDFNSSKISTLNTAFDKKMSEQILLFTKTEIEKLFENTYKISEKLFKEVPERKNEGIEKQLNKAKFTEISKIEFNFTNGLLEKTLEILKEHISKDFTIDFVEKAMNENVEHHNFIDKLNTIANTNHVTVYIDVQEELTKHFYSYRNKYDTLSAIHKLLIIGLIDSYEINPLKESYIVSFKKKTNLDYKKNLEKYISRYVSIESTAKFNYTLEKYHGKTIAEKCVNYLINFTYENIVSHKQNEIKQIDKLCRKGVKGLNNSEIYDLFEKYPTEKYNNKLISPSLLLDTENFKKQDFDTVIKYIRIAGASKSNKKHLLKSTEKALKDNPKNYSLLLINSFTEFWDEHENEKSFEDAFSKLTEGFNIYEKSENLSYEENIDKKHFFLEKLYAHDSELRKKIDSLFFIKIHADWLENFNKKFLKK